MNRRYWTLSVLFFLLIFVLAGCGIGKPDFRIGYQVIPNTEAVAKAFAWHEERIKDANIKWYEFASGRDANAAIASGSIDVATLGSTLVATGLASGLDYKVIWLADVIGENEALVVKNGIDSMAGLKGKKIAVTFGSTTQYSLLGALNLHKISPNELQILDMRPPEMLAAWKRGDIDGGFVWQPTLQEMKEDGGKVLISGKELTEEGIVTADVIVVRKAFAEKYPDLVKAYIESQIRAAELFREKPEEAAAAVGKLFGIPQEQALTMMKEQIWLDGKEQGSKQFLGDGTAPGAFARVLEDTARFLLEQKLIDKLPDSQVFDETVWPEFVLRANESR